VKDADIWASQPRLKSASHEDILFKEMYTGPDKYRNAPINLQLVTRRFEEEKLLLMVDEVLKSLEYRIPCEYAEVQ
jgi:hypothetical protein